MDNKIDIDKKIADIASRVSLPKGHRAPSAEHFDKLLTRLVDKPVPYMPENRFFSGYRKWASAACVLIMCGLGYAMVNGVMNGWSFGWNSPEVENSSNINAGRAFTNVSLGEVFSWVESRYGLVINVDDSELLSYHVTVEFMDDEDLMTVMDILSDIGGFDYEINGKVVTIERY